MSDPVKTTALPIAHKMKAHKPLDYLQPGGFLNLCTLEQAENDIAQN